MTENKKQKIYILDTSAVLSGKPISFEDAIIMSTLGVSNELKPGGRDYQIFQFLKEKGLKIISPSKESLDKIQNISKETGDIDRLSDADKEILALSLDIQREKNQEAIILTDDYSIQNMAYVLKIKFENISQKGITKKFKWNYQCLGCGKKFKDNIKVCPICGSLTKKVVCNKKDI